MLEVSFDRIHEDGRKLYAGSIEAADPRELVIKWSLFLATAERGVYFATYRGSLVLSLGYNRVRPYDSNFGYSWYNATPGDSVGQRWSEVEEGGLNNWAIAIATEVAPNFSVGGALNIWSGKNEY